MQNLLDKKEPFYERSYLTGSCLEESLIAPEEIINKLKDLFTSEPQFNSNLTCYARKNIRFYFSSDSINGLTAQDVVQIVIEKIITGIRKWNKSLIPDIKSLLFLAVKSFIRNEKRRKRRNILCDFTRVNIELKGVFVSYSIDEADINNDEDNSYDFEKVIEELKNLLLNDVYAYMVLEEMLAGKYSNIAIGKSLGISVNDVENAKKRIRCKVKRLEVGKE